MHVEPRGQLCGVFNIFMGVGNRILVNKLMCQVPFIS